MSGNMSRETTGRRWRKQEDEGEHPQEELERKGAAEQDGQWKAEEGQGGGDHEEERLGSRKVPRAGARAPF